MAGRKILFLTRALDVGGAQRQVVELASGLHRAGWKVIVATFYGGGAFEAILQEAGVPVVCLEKSGRWDVLSFLWRLLRLIRRERPDIVHGYLDSPNVLLTLLRPSLHKTPVVWGLASSEADMSYYDWFCGFEFRLGVMFSRFADLIISNSHAGVRYHGAHGYRRDRMIVIAQGIDLQRFKPDAGSRAQIRDEWDIQPNERLVGVVARLDPMKGHPAFLRAASEIALLRADVRFVCIGDGPSSYKEQLAQLVSELGLQERLIWAGMRTDMPKIYNALDLSVLPSSFGEGLPNAVAEAMATGLPCIVTDVGDSALLVGDTGWICPPNDPAALVRTLAAALDALPYNPSIARERIRRHYSADGQLEQSARALSRLLTGEPSLQQRQ